MRRTPTRPAPHRAQPVRRAADLLPAQRPARRTDRSRCASS